MAKVKNKKRNTADAIRSKQSTLHKIRSNPFEIHMNKHKFSVLGQKLKNDKGLPGISRSKALKKRKNTLLPEFNLKNKTNHFFDKRIGEKNKLMTNEDKITVRFTAERVKLHKKKSIFNLGDDEILTHRGQTLSEIEKFDDPRSDDEFSDDGIHTSGGLTSDFVGDAHFGGGVLSNTGKEGAKSRKDLIEQLIAESKKRKAEKQKLREQTIELTEKLDSEWKDLLPLVNKNKKDGIEENIKNDDYDKVMQELRFEARGQPTDRLKTEDEIAKEEKEKLEKLEQNRLARMKGFVDGDENKSKHRSADDLDDNFAYESDTEAVLSYGENEKMNSVKHDEQNSEHNKDDENINEADDGDSGEDESESDNLSDLKEDSSDSDNEFAADECSINDLLTQNHEPQNNNQSVHIEKKILKPHIDYIPENVYTKMKNKDNQKEEKIQRHEKNFNIDILANIENVLCSQTDKLVPKSLINSSINPSHSEELYNYEQEIQNKIKIDLLKIKEGMERARKELPYTYSIPENYEALQKILDEQSPDHQSVILERMIKCTHISLCEANKDKISTLFTYIMQYLNDVALNAEDEKSIIYCFQVFDRLMPHIYDIAQMNKENAHNSILEIVKEKQNDYRKNYKKYPGLDTIIFLKLISLLFPTSDFRHQTVTPALVFIGQMLTKCKVKTKKDISTGLFLVTLVLEYTSLSKRFLPPAINFLRGLIHMALRKTFISTIKIIPPFKSIGPSSSMLVLTEPFLSKTDLIMKASDFINTNIDDDFKVRTFCCVLKLCLEFYLNVEVLESSCEIFEPILDLLEIINDDMYSEDVRKELHRVINYITNSKENKKIAYLVFEKQRPKALRLYEPNIQKIFDTKRHKITSKEKAEKEKLLHKYKKEMKGALREIRRDNAFLTKLKINKQIESDVERKRKVKELFSSASIQQSELNALDRKRKKTNK